MSGPTDVLLSRLDKVKPSRRPGHWIARCPAHEDKSPSLAIREMDDGRILLKCFGGCPTSDVLAALGLEFSDLYPERPTLPTALNAAHSPPATLYAALPMKP